jgi:protein-S-isoprenylcysteine O-methyltransferase Ste14
VDPLRIGLFGGLVLHKAVWEALRLRGAAAPVARVSRSPLTRLVKLAKMVVLAFLLLQTLALDVLPISEHPGPLRAAGVLLYAAGLALAIAGRVQLGPSWTNLEDGGAPARAPLVTRGVYAYIRHPIYTGDLLLLLGLELALNSWLVLAVAIPAAIAVRKARAEETALARQSPEYAAYRRRTRAFIPFVV